MAVVSSPLVAPSYILCLLPSWVPGSSPEPGGPWAGWAWVVVGCPAPDGSGDPLPLFLSKQSLPRAPFPGMRVVFPAARYRGPASGRRGGAGTAGHPLVLHQTHYNELNTQTHTHKGMHAVAHSHIHTQTCIGQHLHSHAWNACFHYFKPFNFL